MPSPSRSPLGEFQGADRIAAGQIVPVRPVLPRSSGARQSILPSRLLRVMTVRLSVRSSVTLSARPRSLLTTSARPSPSRSPAGWKPPSARQDSAASPRNAQTLPPSSPQRSARPSPSRSAVSGRGQALDRVQLATGCCGQHVHDRRVGSHERRLDVRSDHSSQSPDRASANRLFHGPTRRERPRACNRHDRRPSASARVSLRSWRKRRRRRCGSGSRLLPDVPRRALRRPLLWRDTTIKSRVPSASRSGALSK